MQFGRGVADRTRLLAVETEIADEARMHRIRQIVNLCHPSRAPPFDAGNEKRDPGVAFPPVLVRALERTDTAYARRFRGIGNIPNFMRRVAERAQQIELPAIALRQLRAATDAHHLRAAVFA